MPLAKIAAIKTSCKIGGHRRHNSDIRPVVQSSLGCHYVGAALPKPDISDPVTAEAGVRKRFCFQPPRPSRRVLKRLRAFVRTWCRKHLTPLAPDSDVSVESWLDQTDYPAWRKQELKAKWDEVKDIWDDPDNFTCKSFIKDETYGEYKHARGINSRSDEFKCAVGPIFRLIEKEVFKLDWFVKKVPVSERPAYIKKRLMRVGAKYYATDYSAFESLFTRELMEACEFELYRYMVRGLPDAVNFIALVESVLGGLNRCEYKHFWVELAATRMSGEMCTSLGNGFSNLMFMLFVCQQVGAHDEIGVVEGDDGLFTMWGTSPTEADFARLGLVIKLQEHSDLCSASFCGIIFDPEDCINVTDPREVLCSFGWTVRQYHGCRPGLKKVLLRCKALSYAHQYPGCPVIAALARYGLRVTRSVDIRGFLEKDRTLSWWERTQLRDASRTRRKSPIWRRGLPLVSLSKGSMAYPGKTS